VLLSALSMSAGTAVAAATADSDLVPSGAGLPTGDIHDFDFFVGTWNGVNRRLKKRWVGSNEWDEFPGSLICGSRLGGVVNLDYEVNFPTKGWSGMTVRTFNVMQRQWYIYWINSTTGVLFPPVIGGFKGNHGEFFGDDTDEGRPVKVRFRWERRGDSKAHWEQAFSRDGKAWETNWTCEHTRLST
jgi:hypothetical protein